MSEQISSHPMPGATVRSPVVPFPGLRPFLDHEAPLLCGRQSQVNEVIALLRESRFAAVVGGRRRFRIR